MNKEISIDQGAIFCIIVCHTTTVKYTSTVYRVGVCNADIP